MNESRQFHIGDILSITTGKLVSPRLMDGIYDILNYITGEDLFTHQLPRAIRACAPFLLRQHPQLAWIDSENVNMDTYREWLAEQMAQYGAILPVYPMPIGTYNGVNPIEELVGMLK